MKRLVVVAGIIVALLAFTNPNQADFREHVRERDGIAGTVGLVLTDLLSGGTGGIRRDNYLVASRFYLGGDGVIPRQHLAWGIAGMFFENDGTSR